MFQACLFLNFSGYIYGISKVWFISMLIRPCLPHINTGKKDKKWPLGKAEKLFHTGTITPSSSTTPVTMSVRNIDAIYPLLLWVVVMRAFRGERCSISQVLLETWHRSYGEGRMIASECCWWKTHKVKDLCCQPHRLWLHLQPKQNMNGSVVQAQVWMGDHPHQ